MEMDKNLQKLHQSRERMPHYREVLDFAARLLSEKGRRKHQESTASGSIDPVKIRVRMEEGTPYLLPADAPFDFSEVEKYFFSLLNGFKEINPVKFQSLQKTMGTKNFRLPPWWTCFLQNQLTERTLEDEFGREGSLLLFLLIQTLKPFLESLAERWRSGLTDLSWTQGYCPFCGGVPGMGEIRQEGKRFLHCSLCNMEWEYPRMKCPYCRNEDPEQLTYFQVEGEAENRVDICLVCRHYLKTIDSRQMGGTLDFEVEDYLTLHLDHLAQEEGYLRPSKLFMDVRKI